VNGLPSSPEPEKAEAAYLLLFPPAEIALVSSLHNSRINYAK
jgi:hypothetical protein